MSDHEDVISRKHLLSGIDELMQSPWFNNGKDFYDNTMRYYGYVERKEAVEVVRDLCIKAESSVTPKQNLCKDCKWWKDSDGTYRRGIGAESRCPINSKKVLEGNGYCYLFEPKMEGEE